MLLLLVDKIGRDCRVLVVVVLMVALEKVRSSTEKRALRAVVVMAVTGNLR